MAKRLAFALGIRFNPSVGTQGFAGGLNSAILRYRGAPAVDPTTPITTPRRPLLQSRLQVRTYLTTTSRTDPIALAPPPQTRREYSCISSNC